MASRPSARPILLPDARLCRAAAGGAQRAPRSCLQYGRGGEAHVDCERGGAAGAALFCRHGTLGDLQFVADRAGRGNLPCYAVANRALDQSAGAAGRPVGRKENLVWRGLWVWGARKGPAPKGENRQGGGGGPPPALFCATNPK